MDRNAAAHFSPGMLASISLRIEALLGLSYPSHRHEELADILLKALPDLGFKTPAEFFHWLQGSAFSLEDAARLSTCLTIGETYFFRENNNIIALEERILDKLIREHRKTARRLRIWSAGCATGEEAYLLAILLLRKLQDIGEWDIQIIGTDINPESIRKAKTGQYRPWSFRQMPEGWREQFFIRVDRDLYQVEPELSRQVSFEVANLINDPRPGPFDLIICRNVFIYFSERAIRQVLEKFSGCLTPHGWFITSATEAWPVQQTGILRVDEHSHGALFRRKGGELLEEVLTPPPAAVWPPDDDKTAGALSFHLAEPEIRPEEPVLSRRPLAVPAGRHAGRAKEPVEDDAAAAVCRKAKELAGVGKIEKAMAVCTEFLDKEPETLEVLLLLALLQQEAGETGKAKATLRKILYLEPDHIMALVRLGLLEAAGNRHLQRALRSLAGLDPDTVVPHSDEHTAKQLSGMLHHLVHPGKPGDEGES
jgi:chemotaxis protein methyltransferase CheR